MKEANDTPNPLIGFIWNVVSATALFILDMIYKRTVDALTEQRRPNTYLSRSVFVVLTTVLFHLLFYLYLPGVYYAISSEKFTSSLILKTLFFQVTIFVIFSVVIATLDLRYFIFKRRMNKHLSNTETAYKYCQKQLH
jgi:uncharacterized membrane protein YagU involved in acid resistance